MQKYFKDIITLKRGFDLPESKRIKGDFYVFSSNGIVGTHNNFKIKSPTVITGRSGSLGTVQYANKNCWPLNTTLYVSDFKGNIPKYIFYLLQSLHLEKYGSGSAVPTLNRNHLDNLVVNSHNIDFQQHIVDIIGSIDDKIENNEKLIDKLYIYLNLQMKKMITNKTIEIEKCGYIEFLKSGIKEFEDEKVYLDTSCVSNKSIINVSYKITYNERPSRANMQPVINSVWFAKLKDSPKYIIVKGDSKELLEKRIFSTGFCGLHIEQFKFNLLAVYFVSDLFDKKKNSLCIGATMQAVNNDTIKSIKIPYFTNDNYNVYNVLSEPILKTIYKLSFENDNLKILKENYLSKFF